MNNDDKSWIIEFIFGIVAFVILIIEIFNDILIVLTSPKDEMMPALIALAVSAIPIIAFIVMMNPNRLLVRLSKKSSTQVRGKFVRTERIKVSDTKEIDAGIYSYTVAGETKETKFVWASNSSKFPDKIDLYIVDGKPVRTDNALLMAEGDRRKVFTIQIVLMILVSISVLSCLIFGFSTIN